MDSTQFSMLMMMIWRALDAMRFVVDDIAHG